MKLTFSLLTITAALFINIAYAQNGAAPKGPARPTGYLTEATRPDVVRLVPSSPKPGDPRDQSDAAIFKATRVLEGSSRWAMALADNSITFAAVWKNFQCALGITATPEEAPQVSAVIRRANVETGAAANLLKNLYKRQRPFETNQGAVCLPPNEAANLAKGSPDYPSGHSSYGWTFGSILAELAPDRSTEILARARAFGDSRTICGVHNASAVEAGRDTVNVVMTALHGSEAFRADLEAARAELTALRAKPASEGQSCTEERTLVSTLPY